MFPAWSLLCVFVCGAEGVNLFVSVLQQVQGNPFYYGQLRTSTHIVHHQWRRKSCKTQNTSGSELATGGCERQGGGSVCVWGGGGCRDQPAVHRESLWWQQSGGSREWGLVREEGLRGSWLRNQPSLWMIQLTAPPAGSAGPAVPRDRGLYRTGMWLAALFWRKKRNTNWSQDSTTVP